MLWRSVQAIKWMTISVKKKKKKVSEWLPKLSLVFSFFIFLSCYFSFSSSFYSFTLSLPLFSFTLSHSFSLSHCCPFFFIFLTHTPFFTSTVLLFFFLMLFFSFTCFLVHSFSLIPFFSFSHDLSGFFSFTLWLFLSCSFSLPLFRSYSCTLFLFLSLSLALRKWVRVTERKKKDLEREKKCVREGKNILFHKIVTPNWLKYQPDFILIKQFLSNYLKDEMFYTAFKTSTHLVPMKCLYFLFVRFKQKIFKQLQ